MSRECRRARQALMESRGPRPDRLQAHVDRCTGCRTFESRVTAMHRVLAEHHAGVEPDAGFVNRVLARHAGATAETLGWAAARLLPVGLALALTLGWISWSVSGDTEASGPLAAPTEDPLSWILEENGERS